MKSQKHYKRQHTRGPRRSSSSSGGGNPLSRVYESNGPDVKVRGTAQTVAEKYLQLGRDAQVSGDIIMAESYYQHAEHYLRIVAAAQAYTQQNQQHYRRSGEDDLDEDGSEEGEEAAGGDEQPQVQPERPAYARSEPPEHPTEPADGTSEGERQQPYVRRDRNDQGHERSDRHNSKSRWDRSRDRSRTDYQPRDQRDYTDPARQPQPRIEEPAREPVAAATEPGSWEAPSFLRRPPSQEGNGERKSRYERKPKREPEAAEPPLTTEDAPPAE